MKKFLLCAVSLAASAAAVAFAGSASATDFAGGTISYNVEATSDYVFRGLSQSSSKYSTPAIQGGIDYSHGLFYVGTWASNVDFDGAKDYELDLYAGIKPTYQDFSFDFGVVTYQYGTKGLNQSEVKALVSHPLYKGTIGAAFYDNVSYAESGYYEVNASYPLTSKLSVSGAVGEAAVGGYKYSTANLGLTYAITPVFSVDVRAADTNIPETSFTKFAKPRIAVTLKAAF